MHPTDETTEPGTRALPIFLTSGSNRPVSGVDASHRAPILEVHHLWDDQLLDTEHFGPDTEKVTVGADIGWRWSLLGVDLGFVPRPLATPLSLFPPMLSEVDADWRCDFIGPERWFAEPHTLFHRDGDQWSATIPAGWTGELTRGKSRRSLESLVADGAASRFDGELTLPLQAGDRLLIHQGECRFVAHLVPPGNRTRVAPPPDLPFAAVLSAVTAIGALFGLLVALAPAPAATTVLELPPTITEAVFQMPSPPAPVEPTPVAHSKASESGRARPTSQGRSGRRDARQAEARGSRGSLSRRQADRQVVSDAGILGMLSESGMPSGIFGSDMSDEVVAAVGGLRGPAGTRLGTGGLHDRGDGYGADGEVEGTGIGTSGTGGGAGCSDSGPCDGAPNIGTHSEGKIGSGGNEVMILNPGYPKEFVDEVVKRNMARIRYCYQRELTKDPNLGGKLVVKFVIAKDGSVSSASTKSSSLGNSSVDQCVNTRFQQMTFPAPPNGIVVVSYPFLFSPQ